MTDFPVKGALPYGPQLKAYIDESVVPYAALGGRPGGGGATFTSTSDPLRSTTYFGLGAGVGSARNPFFMNQVLDGPSMLDTLVAGGGDDYVGSQINVKFQGGFTSRKDTLTGSIDSGSSTLTLTAPPPARVVAGWTVVITGAGSGGSDHKVKITNVAGSTLTLASAAGATVSGATVIASLAADHNYLFGANDFFTTDSIAGAVAGIDHIYGRLSEVHVYTPNAALINVRGLQSEAAVEASAGAGATVTNLTSLYARAPKNNAGATVTNAYGLYVDGTPTPGATNHFGLFVSNGGKTKLTGPTEIQAQTATDSPLTLVAPLGATGVSRLIQGYDVTKTNRVFHVTPAGAINSVSSVTAGEGLSSSQVTMGQQTGGLPGVAFGNNAGVRLVLANAAAAAGLGDLKISAGRSFTVPGFTTASRPSASAVPDGAQIYDTDLDKPLWSNGSVWKDSAGVAA